jgi:hypothetical protein
LALAVRAATPAIGTYALTLARAARPTTPTIGTYALTFAGTVPGAATVGYLLTRKIGGCDKTGHDYEIGRDNTVGLALMDHRILAATGAARPTALGTSCLIRATAACGLYHLRAKPLIYKATLYQDTVTQTVTAFHLFRRQGLDRNIYTVYGKGLSEFFGGLFHGLLSSRGEITYASVGFADLVPGNGERLDIILDLGRLRVDLFGFSPAAYQGNSDNQKNGQLLHGRVSFEVCLKSPELHVGSVTSPAARMLADIQKGNINGFGFQAIESRSILGVSTPPRPVPEVVFPSR